MTDLSPEMAMLLASHVAAADIPITVADATRADYPVVYVNAAFVRLTGYRSDQVLGRTRRILHGPGTDQQAARAADENLRAGRPTVSRLLSYRADGSTFWNEMRISPVRADDSGAVTGFIGIHLDVTAQVAAHREELRAATRDPLTGLASRGQFEEHLEHELARAARHRTSVAVLFADIDEFKKVNDTSGHQVGDGYLIHVAESLRGRLRGQDTIARLGGDEFVAMVTDLPNEGGELAAARVLGDVDRAMRAPFTVNGAEYRTTVSIGAAVYPADATTGRDLIAAADAAMYARKRRGGGGRRSAV